ncbi:MAG TPA: sulfatase-like hydrolase/transferase [Mycobacteriales bacterium]|nr:sulfatase-like hydrolase/transferase [Mycobacteriales bacterium]
MSDHRGSRPNILLVMTDSSRRDTIGCYGAPHAVSPHLDQLAAEGMRFDQAHTTAPVCMPARCSLLTGTHPPVHGCIENGIARRAELVTLPDVLAAAGYHSIIVGKAHFGGPVPASFTRRHVLGGEKGANVDDEYARHLARHGFARASAHPNAIPEELFCEAFLVEQTIEEIDRHRAESPDHPFFAFCSMPSPHSPLDPPGRWATLFDDRDLPSLNYRSGEESAWPPHLQRLIGARGVEAHDAEQPDGTLDPEHILEQRRRYYGLAAYCDDQVGRLLAHLDATGLRDSTLVVFTTDHGQQYYDHGFNDKHTFYDESWRIPLLMRWPGVIAPGSTADWAMTTDLMATFAAAAGVESPTAQGFDLLRPVAERTCAAAVLHRSLALATDTWKLEYFPEEHSGRLFDRRHDPAEQHDRWSDPAAGETRAALLELLLTWRADLTDVQYLQQHTSRGGPVARRVADQTMRRTGADAELRLQQRVARLT